MNHAQQIRPLTLNMDKHPKELGEMEAAYLLNHERYLNEDGTKKGTLGKTTPMVANMPACEMQMPTGENYSVGEYESKKTNELYSWVYNNNGVNFIQRLTSSGECQIVYHGCLDLSAAPKHKIKNFRAYMKYDKICSNAHGKQLIWTNGEHEIGMIDVEASINTNFFTTPFFQRCADPCAYVQMCVPDPCGCLHGEFMAPDPNERGLNNNVVDVGLKFSYRHVYYDGRASIWAEPSSLYYQNARGCFESTEGLPRCVKLRVPIGNPLVDKIEIAFWKDGVWYLYDTVDKYKKYNDTQQFWYERNLAELLNYSDTDCSFDYIFCNDKQCQAIDPVEFNRVYNPMPRKPQGLLPIGLNNQDAESLAFYNYISGNCPVDLKETQKFDIDITCPEDKCNQEYVTLTIRAIIHNRTHDRNQFIYRLGGTASNAPDDPSEPAFFGGLNPSLDGGFETGYDQTFKDDVRNFIAYIEGTDYWVEMDQWKAHRYFTNIEKWDVVAGMDDVNRRNRWRRAASNGEFFYQEAKLKVLKGTKGFIRLASHQATGNEQDTSTFVIGIMNDITQYKGDIGTAGLNAITDFAKEEIYFEACDGDLELNELFLIEDNAVDEGSSDKASAYYGYIKDSGGLPVEGAVIYIEHALLPGTYIPVCITDHNGFYHFYKNPGTDNAIDMQIHVEQDCYNFTNIATVSVQSQRGFNTRLDYTIDNDTYRDGFYANVKMQVVTCDGQPIPGVRVALSGSKYKVTGADGFALFRIRNYSTRDRVVKGVAINLNGCIEVGCDGSCNPCMFSDEQNTIPCYYDKPTITLHQARINTLNLIANSRGLKHGGQYPFGIVVKGDCGVQSAVYPVKNINIPKVQESGNDQFCSFEYNGGGIVLPEWAKCVDIVRGKNLNPFELQWVVDEFERTDDGKIKLTIQSLNDYNSRYFFKTNTSYQWLKGDRVEFIRNGDGEVFKTSVHGILNYLTISPFHDEDISGETEPPADYFNQLLINDDGKLATLKKGAIIELQRSKECTTEPGYYGICVSIPVVDGRLQYESGIFDTFDTYKVNRKLEDFPTLTFEHHSPSDFWGERLDDTGRGYFINKYENEKRFGRNITINAPNQFNYFGDLVKKLNPATHGDIIAMWLVDGKIGLAISEYDNSLFEASDDLLRVGGDGIVRAAGPDAVISDAQPKIRGTFGCTYDAVGSIYFGDGWAVWQDVNKHARVKHDYNQAVATDIGKTQTYSKKRCQEIATWNKTHLDPLDQYRFEVGFNSQTNVVYQTIKRLRDSAYNNEDAPFKKGNDTIGYHPDSEDFTSFASFTPEGYGNIDLFDGIGCAMVSYFNGVPYVHPIVPEKFNNFFGVACDRIVTVALNKFKEKIKKGLAVEVQDEMMWYVKDVKVENPSFRSEIPPVRWKKWENKWDAHFLGNINSRGGLFGDDGARDYFHLVTFIRDNTDALKYNTVDNAKREKFDSLDMITFKFMVSEQSGVTENV